MISSQTLLFLVFILMFCFGSGLVCGYYLGRSIITDSTKIAVNLLANFIQDTITSLPIYRVNNSEEAYDQLLSKLNSDDEEMN